MAIVILVTDDSIKKKSVFLVSFHCAAICFDLMECWFEYHKTKQDFKSGSGFSKLILGLTCGNIRLKSAFHLGCHRKGSFLFISI
jgi:hypothetical protein